MPAPRRLIMPARIISRWLATSASAGASFSVETKNWEAFICVTDTGLSSGFFDHGRHAGKRARVVLDRFCVFSNAGAIMVPVKELGSDYARPRGLQAQRRHCAAQLAQPGVLGKASAYAFLAVPARGHQIRRVARAGDVPRAPRGSGAAARPRENPGAYPRLAAL